MARQVSATFLAPPVCVVGRALLRASADGRTVPPVKRFSTVV